jgi:NADPH:quinone reductase-like Zn-dependent oxidoreductase
VKPYTKFFLILTAMTAMASLAITASATGAPPSVSNATPSADTAIQPESVISGYPIPPAIPAANVVPVDDWIDLEAVGLSTGARALTNGRGADVVLDVVGGAMFEQCLAALAWRGRQVAISSSPEPRVSFNLVNFYHNESRLLGVDSLKLSFEETAEILRRLTPGIEAGTFPPPAVETFPFEEGLRLYRDIAESRIKTKPILVP